MEKNNLRLSNVPNKLMVLVKDVEKIESTSSIIGGLINSGVIITVNSYNLDDLLSQMMEDYRAEYLIEKINSLK